VNVVPAVYCQHTIISRISVCADCVSDELLVPVQLVSLLRSGDYVNIFGSLVVQIIVNSYLGLA
jgi:hypothetical protein